MVKKKIFKEKVLRWNAFFLFLYCQLPSERARRTIKHPLNAAMHLLESHYTLFIWLNWKNRIESFLSLTVERKLHFSHFQFRHVSKLTEMIKFYYLKRTLTAKKFVCLKHWFDNVNFRTMGLVWWWPLDKSRKVESNMRQLFSGQVMRQKVSNCTPFVPSINHMDKCKKDK